MFPRFAGFALIALIATACGGKTDSNDGRNSARQQGGPGSDDAPTDTKEPAGSAPSTPSSDPVITAPSTFTGPCKKDPPPEILAEFEDGAIDTHFGAANPVPFGIETAKPLYGGASLRLQPTNSQPAYLLYETGGSCEIWIKLAIRADAAFVASRASILRAYAQSRTFTFLTDPGGDIHVAQEGFFGSGPTGAVGMTPGPVIGKLVADQTTIIKLHVDLATGDFSAGFGEKDIETKISFLNPDAPLSKPAAFTGVMFGIVPGFALDPKGTLWMDDVAVK